MNKEDTNGKERLLKDAQERVLLLEGKCAELEEEVQFLKEEKHTEEGED